MGDFPYDILVCPKTKNPLQKASQTIIDKVNKLIEENKCKNQSDELVSEKIEAGFIDNKENRFYLTIDEIPVLMYNKSVAL